MSAGAAPDGRAASRAGRLAGLAALAAALTVGGLFVARATTLMRYPWDWSPDEGLGLDYARRLVEAPATLYPRSAVPFPVAYGPVLPALLAPLTRLQAPLGPARALMLLSALLGAAAVGVIVRRRCGVAWALAAAALSLAPFDLTFWSLLVRVDGPMTTLWLWGATFLLPSELSRGADRLSGGRIAAGAGLLLAAVLTKPTAAVHAAPLVLGWLLVDRPSAVRLALALAAGGLAALGALETVTAGGFLWALRLWRTHPMVEGLSSAVLLDFLDPGWPLLAVAALAFLAAVGHKAQAHREPAWLLVAGGLAATPLLSKHGAGVNYLLPLAPAAAVAGACWLARAARTHPAPQGGPAGIVLLSVLAVALASGRATPLPTAQDEATGRAFYGFTQEVARRTGGPLLATRPDLVYFLAGQRVEVEGSSFIHLARAGVPGADEVLERLAARHYALVVWTWPLPDSPRWTRALLDGYVRVGECRLGWYFGARFPSHLALRRDLQLAFQPPPGTRCTSTAPAAPGAPD